MSISVAKVGEVLNNTNQNNLHYVLRTASLQEAAKQMSEYNISALLVYNHENRLVGIVTERDLTHAVAQNLSMLSTKVGETMTPRFDLVFIGSNETIESALDIMLKKNIRHLIVENNDDVVGILSMRSTSRYLMNLIHHFQGLIIGGE